MHFLRTFIFQIWLFLDILTSGCAAVLEPKFFSHQANFRTLKAATVYSDILKRTNDLNPVHSAELVYADDENHNGQQPIFSSTLRVESHTPFIVLEHIEHLLTDIQCSKTVLTITFHSRADFDVAQQSWMDLESGHIIATDAGCGYAEEGARVPFQINSATFINDSKTVIFSIEENEWHQAFHHINLSFNHSPELHSFHRPRYHKLNRRQEQESSESPSPTSSPLELTATSLIPSDTATATATSLSIDLSHGVQDVWFPTSLPGGVQPLPSLPIAIGCKQCSTAGTLTLAQGEWDLLDVEDWTDVDNFTDIISLGYVQLVIEDLVAHVELQISPALEGEMSLPLFSIPVFGFAIPRIGAGGILVEPTLSLSWELSGGIEMSYGFELNPDADTSILHAQIPDLNISLNFADPASSTVTGLDDVSLTDVPFQANISDISLTLDLSLTPHITLGMEMFDLLFAEVGTYLDLPKTTVTITQLATDTVNAQCDNRSDDAPLPAHEADFEDLFHNLTHVAGGFELGVGVDMRAGVDGLPRLDFSSAWPLATVPVAALPTKCLAFQTDAPSGPGFTPAVSALAEVQAQADEQTQGSNGAEGSGSSGNGNGNESSEENGASHNGFVAFESVQRKICFCVFFLVAGLFVSL
ncbi:uncharacterized protein Z518_00480 [Rhinocladiella mackenziei CBS 650.93]|uniref:DUF7029 domain-containing protein n=1 Tax=Rhinocladiella mackenziei CBS 650.93 TaxID=1442369 RepID=A0A0D2J133_9EURO|nr:uncharacterized protein Z518_00480 [Rhinocladiella mackenziei CBS 650.93]KIX09401.1 hypothetical protein Z518_00480 [Rhinocladiella mackenziei CBS 650.93]